MRRINEIPTILLGLVVLLAIFKDSLPTNIAAWGTGITVFIFAVIIQLYARKRRSNKQELINYLLASPIGYWFERQTNTPVRVKRIGSGILDNSGLPFSELIARGWLNESAYSDCYLL